MTDAEIMMLAANAAAPYFDLDPADAMSRIRTQDGAKARWAVMYALWQRGWTQARIAAAVGRDHSTVSHGIQRAMRAGQGDERYRDAAAAAVVAVRERVLAWEPPTPQAAKVKREWAVPVPMGAVNG